MTLLAQSVAPFAAVNFTVFETLKELGAVHIASKNVLLSAGYGAVSGMVAMTRECATLRC